MTTITMVRCNVCEARILNLDTAICPAPYVILNARGELLFREDDPGDYCGIPCYFKRIQQLFDDAHNRVLGSPPECPVDRKEEPIEDIAGMKR